MSSIFNVFAIFGTGSVCALYLLPVLIINVFLNIIYKLFHNCNLIVKYHNVGDGRLNNIANATFLKEE